MNQQIQNQQQTQGNSQNQGGQGSNTTMTTPQNPVQGSVPKSPPTPTTQSVQTQPGGGTTNGSSTGSASAPIDLNAIKTPSGKTIKDFKVPPALLKNDPPLIDLVLRSESMNDGERQYWLNLTEVMNKEQVEKLRDILTRERQKLAEIDAKYGKKPKVDPVVAAKQAKEAAEKRAKEQEKIKQQEAAHQAKEAESEEAILAELDDL